MKNLIKSVADYNATYGTTFSVINPVFSLIRVEGEEMLKSPDVYPDTGGVFLFYDRNKDLLAVYSTKKLSDGLRTHLKGERDDEGNWVMKEKWVSDPAYIALVIGNQDRLYEKDSQRSYLIKELNPRYNENGVLLR